MRPLLISSVITIVLASTACSGAYSHRAPLSAKGWDTPFVRVKPIPEPDPNAGAHRPSGRAAWSQAGYGQMPASLDPMTLAAEMQATPGAPNDDAVIPAEAALAADAAASAPTMDEAVRAAALAAPKPVPEAPVIVVAASSAPARPEPDIGAWYEARHVDLMPRADWAR